jgi:threonine/homoserine/homoserine lactone efflux protein
MEALDFVATVVLITASGALAPGPLFFANLSEGAKAGAKSGLLFSLAHTLVEFTLVMLLVLGLLAVVNEYAVRLVVGVVGGTVLMVFGATQVYSSLRSKLLEPRKGNGTSRNLFLIGLAFTGLNPFFLVWCLTAGAQLIVISLEFASLAGVVLMYLCHVWMDYVWLSTTAHLSKMGKDVVGLKEYRLVLTVFGMVLIYFGFSFITGSFTS